jgi:hypothetical protein
MQRVTLQNASAARQSRNGQKIIAIRILFTSFGGHPQPATPLKTVAQPRTESFVHANIKQRRSKTWDMRWNWLQDKATHKELRVHWAKGADNGRRLFHKTPSTVASHYYTLNECFECASGVTSQPHFKVRCVQIPTVTQYVTPSIT